MNERRNSFAGVGDNLVQPPAFQIKPKQSNPVDSAAVDKIAEQEDFPSRKAQTPRQPHKQRRHTTGRNQQINLKATAETVERFNRLADQRKLTLCQTLEAALDALEKSTTQR